MLYDWVAQYIEQGLDHFGRITEAKHLTEENAWIKDYDWRMMMNSKIDISFIME